MIKTTTNIIATKARAYRDISSTEVPVTPDTTKRLRPSGGVIKPIPNAVIIKMQKWISCIPISNASGSSSGERITILGLLPSYHYY